MVIYIPTCVRINVHSRVLYHTIYGRACPKTETTLTKQTPISYPNNLILVHTESQLMLAKFEEKNCT
jgi:hypothetical protein